jgi:membrane-bound lytic murein transglycosylase A
VDPPLNIFPELDMPMPRSLRCLLLALLLFFAACAAPPVPPVAPTEPTVAPSRLQVSWEELPGWGGHDPRPALAVFRDGCATLRRRPGWRQACAAVRNFRPEDPAAARIFVEAYFTPYRLQKPDGDATGRKPDGVGIRTALGE